MQTQDLLKKYRDLLGEHKNAALDGELILAHVLGESREYILAHKDEDVSPEFIELFKKYTERAIEGEPVAYITNEKEFFGLNFYVDKRVLIPRPETEQIVERALDFIESEKESAPFRVLDVGTGSGNIAVSIGRNSHVEEVLSVDIDAKALEVAKINVNQYSLENKVQLAQSDLLEAVSENEEFDIIVANLPYIGEVKNKFVSASTEKYEPHCALFGGESGVELYQKMFWQLKEKNVQFKMMIGEFGFAQKEIMEELLIENFGEKWKIEKDLAGIERIFIITNN